MSRIGAGIRRPLPPPRQNGIMSLINRNRISARLCRVRTITIFTALLLSGSSSVLALSADEREELDLSEYRVQKPDASYFDVDARMELLRTTPNSLLLQHRDELSLGPSCQQLKAIPPITEQQRIPGFYPQQEAWELASEPLFKFEESVSSLAGSYVASGDIYYAECLIAFLNHWAEQDALMDFYYDPSQPQAWFATESMIFAAAMAYSIIRPAIDGMEEELSTIEDWLNDLSYLHLSIPGLEGNSCCNNHFYRRALYASMVGVLTEDNELFRVGVSAIYSALHDMTEEGALPLEVERGRRATHYQNYALLYLITNMEIIQRQGYDIYDLEIDGVDIHDGVDFALSVMEDPSRFDDLAPLEQYTDFMKDEQYFSWMEIYQARFDDPRIPQFLETLRPIYNRSAGGFVTLYYMDPATQQDFVRDRQRNETMAFEGLEWK